MITENIMVTGRSATPVNRIPARALNKGDTLVDRVAESRGQQG